MIHFFLLPLIEVQLFRELDRELLSEPFLSREGEDKASKLDVSRAVMS